jgi:hypothetical protein
LKVTITITEPAPFSNITKVKCAMPGDTSGKICACGNATDARGVIDRVWAKVVTLSTTLTDPHPGDAQEGSRDQTTGNWWFLDAKLVPNVPCDPYPGDNNYLFAVWVSYQNVANEEHQSTKIAARCDTATNCDDPTTNPCANISRRLRGAGASASTGTVSTAPRQYQVKGKGATGPLASLVNTTWALSLRTGSCGCTFAWDNEGDGIRVARVVLRPDGVISTEWNLTLVLNGRRAQYTCPAPEWKALGVNRLRRASGDESMPKILTVTPV